MTALYLLAAHLVGDFVLQTRWQAAGKLADARLRVRHVLTYSVPFYPVALLEADGWRAVAFMSALLFLHALTDSGRFHSTLGDWVGWHLMGKAEQNDEVVARIAPEVVLLDLPQGPFPSIVQRTPVGPLRLPANPWTPIPILIDQALHVCQLALLGGLFLT